MEVKPGKYKHFKGEMYEIIGVAKHSETMEEVVVYKKLSNDTLWTRPVKMFLEEVERDGYKGPRFVFVGEE